MCHYQQASKRNQKKKKKQKMDTLARANAHPRDAAISFDEPTHIYTIAHDADVRYTSVTTLNGSLFDHFDAAAVAAKVASKPNWKRNKVEYHNKTAAELVAMWSASGEEASRLGTAMHLDIERFYNGLPTVAAANHAAVTAAAAASKNNEIEAPPPPPEDSVEMGYFHRFWNNWRCGHLTPWRTEWCVYWEEYRLAGSIDMVFRDPISGTLEIYDWKRVCKPLEPEHDNPRFPKFAKVDGLRHLPDNAYWHYALQLNMYKRILETQYGEKVTALTLVVLHPNNADFRRVELPFLPKEIDAVLRHRHNELFPPPAVPVPPGGGEEEADDEDMDGDDEEDNNNNDHHDPDTEQEQTGGRGKRRRRSAIHDAFYSGDDDDE